MLRIKEIEPIAVSLPMKKPVIMAGEEVRRADNVEDLLDAIDALVLVPTVAEVEPTSAAAGPAPSPPPKDEVPPKAPASEARPTRLELAIAGAASLSAAPGFAGFGLVGFAQLHVAPHLIGVVVHYDPLGLPLDPESRARLSAVSLSVAAIAGRRVLVGSFHVDLVGGLALFASRQEQKAPKEKAIRATHFEPRLVLGARLAQSGAASLRGYVAVDFSAGWPSSREPAPELLPFPSANAALSLGLLFGAS